MRSDMLVGGIRVRGGTRSSRTSSVSRRTSTRNRRMDLGSRGMSTRMMRMAKRRMRVIMSTSTRGGRTGRIMNTISPQALGGTSTGGHLCPHLSQAVYWCSGAPARIISGGFVNRTFPSKFSLEQFPYKNDQYHKHENQNHVPVPPS
jgi:hypothetical protein